MMEGESEQPTAKERLKQIDEERKVLKEQVKDEREQRLERAAEMRAERDVQIEKVQEKLNEVLKAIYSYNKLGKVAKMRCGIFELINEIIFPESVAEEDN